MSAVPAFVVAATPEAVARWRFGRDGVIAPPPPQGSPLPLAFLVFLRLQPQHGVSIHHLLDRDPDRGLYGGVTYRTARTPRVGDSFAAAGSVTDRREAAGPRGTMLLRTFETRYADAAGEVVTEAVRMIDLPPGPPTAPAAGPARSSPMRRAN